MKNQKGITLMILVVTVIVMALTAGTITYNSVAAIKMRAYYDMCADIELLDEKIALNYLENNGKLPTDETTPNSSAEMTSGENSNPNNNGNFYKIDLTKLDNLSLNNSEYYINEQSHTIYCSTGVTLDGYTYYTVPQNYTKIDLTKYQ